MKVLEVFEEWNDLVREVMRRLSPWRIVSSMERPRLTMIDGGRKDTDKFVRRWMDREVAKRRART